MLDSTDDMVQTSNDYFVSVFTSEHLSSLPQPVPMISELTDQCHDILFTEKDC